ncbi:class I SAM-dependent methyltransferase [Luteimonas yindakuii]|uniref:Class I SAM-dependent methyltransferase n=1 Tax=Luteimonas yindakuii TaxID=2565782 RepID=A0A4Z1RHH8_9GAMM|nr:class I SAM-dependent methyltransferase [Luteimonas yindakuii]
MPMPDPHTHLPEAAYALSARLEALIRAEIHAAPDRAIPFHRFMELALYTPGLGYYSAGMAKFGAEGDFVTAPELGTLFAGAVAEAVAPVLRQLGADAQFVEIGGGSGRFAEHAIGRLLALGAMPARYAILEPSADLRERQREHLRRALPADVFARVTWLDGPLHEPWRGVLFANEVIDALPTPRFAIRGGEVFEEHVAVDAQGAFAITDRPADALLAAAVRHVERQLEAPFADGYRSELLPQLPYWIQAVIGGLDDGAMLFVDYGHARRDYYRPERRDGTLRAFSRHRVGSAVLANPGLQDLTASVDFTALAEAGTGAGFDFAGYCNQASFLLGNGIDRLLGECEAGAADEAGRYRLRQEVKQLTHPDAMGERFQVMGFARDVDLDHAFLAGDLSHRL